MKQEQLIKMRGISIEFPGVKALNNVDFNVWPGTIQALVGANGAGKSTLMKVLTGAEPSYTGDIFVQEQETKMTSPHKAQALGIQIVFQEVDMALVPNLSVAENILLNKTVNQMKKRLFMNWKAIHAQAKEVLNKLNIQIDTHKNVSHLTLAQKQMVLIARAIAQNNRVLILDEPTAPLSNKETQELFRIVRELSQTHGVGVIFISHRLPEVFELCERVTVMKDGQVVAEELIKDVDIPTVINYMLGRDFTANYSQKHTISDETVIELKNYTAKNEAVKNINLQVRKGEIVGISGLVGAGKSELCKTIFGDYKHIAGSLSICGKETAVQSPRAAVKNGIVLVPEERRKEGVVVSQPVFSNLSIANLDSFSDKLSFVNRKKEKENADNMVGRLGIKTPSIQQKVALLSGGNQQKVAVGKWLSTDALVYVFDEPTKGVDVGAKADIFKIIHELANNGKSIIYASCEFSEILGITDRVYVMYDREIVKELKTSQTNEAELLYYSTGGK